MINKLYILIFTLIILCNNTSNHSFAQTTVTIGTGTNYDTKAPFARNYNYGWSSTIYRQSEISIAGSIVSIAFEDRVGTATNWGNQKIYMRHTTATIPSTTRPTAAELSSVWTLVYSGAILYDAAWKTITLTSSFNYNNVDNLELYYLNYKGTNTINGPDFRYTNRATNRTVYYRVDNQATFDANTTGVTTTRTPNVKLVIDWPMPVELTSLYAKCKPDKNIISWSTASESNSDYFTVEKSYDASTWALLWTVKAAGNSNAVINYSVDDNKPPYDGRYYRLSQTDYDGVTEYFDVVASNCASITLQSDVKFHASASSNTIVIELINMPYESASIIVSDLLGRVVYESGFMMGDKSVNCNLDNLINGIYVIRFASRSIVKANKLIKF